MPYNNKNKYPIFIERKEPVVEKVKVSVERDRTNDITNKKKMKTIIKKNYNQFSY